MLQAAGRKTNNLCFNDEGADYIGSCKDSEFNLCDNFTLLEGSTCNVITYETTQIRYSSPMVDTMQWQYLLDADGQCTVLEMLAPKIYKSTSKLEVSKEGNCGYKFQLINRSKTVKYSIKVLQDWIEPIV